LIGVEVLRGVDMFQSITIDEYALSPSPNLSTNVFPVAHAFLGALVKPGETICESSKSI
jgi:hypothetical protein